MRNHHYYTGRNGICEIIFLAKIEDKDFPQKFHP